MQNEVLPSGSNSKNKVPTFIDSDDFDFETFEVRPLSKGLGFHQGKERPTPKTARVVQATTSTRSHHRPSAFDKKIITPPSQSQMVSQQDLAAFYGQPKIAEQPTGQLKNSEVMQRESYVSATFSDRALAWGIDFLIVVLLCSILFSSFLVISEVGFSLERLTSIFTSLELFSFGLALYGLMNLFYFTILDIGTTPGKSILGLRTLNKQGNSISGLQSFTRALVSLISCFAVGLPLLLDFQSHLSDTKVYKKNV